MRKMVIYQVLPRLFGNSKVNIQPNGTLAQNGVGKMAHFTQRALNEIKALGTTHIWYTGIIEHATQTSYAQFGIQPDHHAIVKGKAGSPYAIKDYYNVDPDIAEDPRQRMAEFENLVKRTHKAGLGVIIDFVPNHVARQYHSSSPHCKENLGQNDNTQHAFHPQNNFYYIPNQPFAPQFDIEDYAECPARATGNDHFSPSPHRNDWYETIKLNYGIDYQSGQRCFNPIPNTWHKMLHILLFWAGKNINGFRCDMAEMVPVEFWHWAIPQVKAAYPQIIFIAEVYNPAQYRSFIHHGQFDYLYDKVGLYDTLRAVVSHQASTRQITQCWQQVDDIRPHMLNFLENHDEQRIASTFFAGDAKQGKAPLLVSALMGNNPMMIYFGQELGEKGMDEEGFSGLDGRTTIFDYWRIDTISRWRNKGKCNANLLSAEEKDLQQFYARVLNLCLKRKAIQNGAFFDLMYVNPHLHRQYAFVRHTQGDTLLIVANFDESPQSLQITIPQHLFDHLQIAQKDSAQWTELLSDKNCVAAFNTHRPTCLTIDALSGGVFKLNA